MSGIWTAPKTWGPVELPSAEMNAYIRDNENYLKTHIAVEAASELTINAGVIAVTQAYHTIDTEADAATDDLDTIGGGNEGMIIILRAEHTDRTVILKNLAGNLVLGADIPLDDTNKHVALICDSAGNWYLLFCAREFTFCINAFQYPASGTDWAPKLEGAGLAQSLTAKKVWLPLNFLKQGDVIVGYRLVGDAVEVATLTLDCKLVRINKADPLTTTDIAGGGITQITADGNFDSAATLTTPEVVATDKQYTLEILGTTDTGDSITVMGAEVIIRRLV